MPVYFIYYLVLLSRNLNKTQNSHIFSGKSRSHSKPENTKWERNPNSNNCLIINTARTRCSKSASPTLPCKTVSNLCLSIPSHNQPESNFCGRTVSKINGSCAFNETASLRNNINCNLSGINSISNYQMRSSSNCISPEVSIVPTNDKVRTQLNNNGNIMYFNRKAEVENDNQNSHRVIQSIDYPAPMANNAKQEYQTTLTTEECNRYRKYSNNSYLSEKRFNSNHQNELNAYYMPNTLHSEWSIQDPWLKSNQSICETEIMMNNPAIKLDYTVNLKLCT